MTKWGLSQECEVGFLLKKVGVVHINKLKDKKTNDHFNRYKEKVFDKIQLPPMLKTVSKLETELPQSMMNICKKTSS